MFNDLRSPVTYISTRRSCRPRDMMAPGPDMNELRQIVQVALRTPDHGKLVPWRVVHVKPAQRNMLSESLQAVYLHERPDAGRLELEAMDMFARHAPELLTILYSPRKSSKIPEWEQQLSAGAFCMNILHAAHIQGFVGGWITGWPAYSDQVRDMFGAAPERIAGFIYIGTPVSPLEERPRPALDDVFKDWNPQPYSSLRDTA